MHWSPPFEGPLMVPFDDVAPYYAAYKVAHELIESGQFTIEFKLQEGDTVIFNQRRYIFVVDTIMLLLTTGIFVGCFMVAKPILWI